MKVEKFLFAGTEYIIVDKFIFDNGSVFTKHDIISNIVKCQSKKEEWKIA